MTYWDVNFIFLGIAALVLLVAVVLRRPRLMFWGALGAATLLLFVLTAIFDNLMIAAGIMTYTDQNISGVQVGLAPLEDFAYPLAGVLLLPGLWLLLGGRISTVSRVLRDSGSDSARAGSGSPSAGQDGAPASAQRQPSEQHGQLDNPRETRDH